MSGLVFVLDAQGRPLMPTSAAYARTMLRQQKAQREPHPTFTIIRLTQSVASPIVRPVLLIIVLHRTTAELLLEIETARTSPQSLSILVDLSVMDHHFHRYHHNGGRSRLKQHRLTHPEPAIFGVPAALSGVIARRHVHTLTQVLTLLQSLIPISYIAFAPVPARSHPVDQIERLLVRDLQLYAPHITIITQEQSLIVTLPPPFGRTLLDVAVGRRFTTPQIVATIPSYQRTRVRQQAEQLQPTSGIQLSEAIMRRGEQSRHRGQTQLCTIQLNKRTITGIINARTSDGELLIRVVHRAGSDGVIWQWLRINAIVPRRLWPSMSVLVLSISP